MAKLSSNKNLIAGAIVVIILLIFAYWYFSGSSAPEAPILSGTATVGSNDLLSTLNELKSLSLDSSIFQRPAFKALSNETVILPTVVSGRANPFAPLPGFVGSAGAVGALAVPAGGLATPTH